MMEAAGSKRKPAAQLTKDELEAQQHGADAAAEPEGSLDMKEADANTLKNRRRLKIVRAQGQAPTGPAESQQAAEKPHEPKPETTETAAPEAEETPAAAAETKQAEAPGAEAAKPAAEGESSKGTAAVAAPDAAAANGETAADTNQSNSSGSSSSSSGGGLFGSVLKGTPAFVSPFGSLGVAGSSFLLPSGGGPSVFGGAPSSGPSGASAAAGERDEVDVPPPEEPTVVATTVDSKEEIVFTDRDCRMQCFDVDNKVWAPKPPLDGKVDVVVPKKDGEGLPNARILFFVNRTGRLRLNSPVLPSSVKFRHPVERAAASAGAKAAAAGAVAASDGDAKEEKKEMPLKKNTVEFTGLKVDAKDSKDTTFYRIRFSSDDRAAAFMSLANAKQEEATKASLNGKTTK